jgi:hypothetical protein
VTCQRNLKASNILSHCLYRIGYRNALYSPSEYWIASYSNTRTGIFDFKANESIFWRFFNDLSKNNNGLVAYDKLQERLISTGKLDAGATVLMILSDYKFWSQRIL